MRPWGQVVVHLLQFRQRAVSMTYFSSSVWIADIGQILMHAPQSLQASVPRPGTIAPMTPMSFSVALAQLFGQPVTAILNLYGASAAKYLRSSSPGDLLRVEDTPPAGLGTGTGRDDPDAGAVRPHGHARGLQLAHGRSGVGGAHEVDLDPLPRREVQPAPAVPLRPLRQSSASARRRTPRRRRGAAGRRSPSASAGWCRASFPASSHGPVSVMLSLVQPVGGGAHIALPCRGRCHIPGGDLTALPQR